MLLLSNSPCNLGQAYESVLSLAYLGQFAMNPHVKLLLCAFYNMCNPLNQHTLPSPPLPVSRRSESPNAQLTLRTQTSHTKFYTCFFCDYFAVGRVVSRTETYSSEQMIWIVFQFDCTEYEHDRYQSIRCASGSCNEIKQIETGGIYNWQTTRDVALRYVECNV